MALAILDNRDSQTVCDLRTGQPVDDDSPKTRIVREILQHHPYPGDTYLGNRWVSDTALELMDRYRPQLVCLLYAYQYFAMRRIEQDEMDRRRMLKNAFREVARFASASHFATVVVGTGDLVPRAGEIDLSGLGARAVSSHDSGRYAGLHQPTEDDLAYVSAQPQVQRLVSRAEWEALFPGAQHDPARLPAYLAVAQPGWTFRTSSSAGRQNPMIPGESRLIPVMTKLGEAKSITGVRRLVEGRLDRTKIALVVVEGMGLSDFALQHEECENGADWFCYEPGEAQLLTLTTGTHQVFAHPPGTRGVAAAGVPGSEYPFSGQFSEVPEHTVGREFSGRSIAVGNHGMLTHMVFGADIALECPAPGSDIRGCLGVIHR
jgi:hypothetical protein